MNKVDLTSRVVTPLLENISPLGGVVIFIDSFYNQFYYVLKLDIIDTLLHLLFFCDFHKLCSVSLKVVKLHLSLEDSIVDVHNFTLYLVLPLFDICILQKILKAHFEYVKLTFLAMLHRFFQKTMLSVFKLSIIVPPFKTSDKVNFVKMGECIR